jgi:putative Ca2+/H+ antiporter (TMEM165/GDT1 family)
VSSNTPSKKVGAAALGAALATLLWILLGAYVTTKLSKEAIAALTGATSTIFAFALGYLVPG